MTMAHGRAASALTALTLMVALSYIDPAHGLECYRCMSTNSSRPFLCNEFLTHGYEIEPEPCDDVYDAKYCIKHVGRFEGGIGTKRFCSSVDLGNYCDYVKQPGDKLSYRTCVYTCDSHGCNPATATSRPNDRLLTAAYLALAMLIGGGLFGGHRLAR